MKECLDIENNDCFHDEKPSFSPPNSNFTFHASENYTKNSSKFIENLYQKIENCGKKKIEFINSKTSEITEFPAYCNNRVCNNPNCKEHRGYLFNKIHFNQINHLEENIRKPKAWVFTGWKIDLTEIKREDLQNKVKKLNRLLKNFSTSSYSMHLEIKLYPIEHKDYGKAYIHFHVATGGIKNYNLVQKQWGRYIKYEKAISQKNLSKYISKYSSKTPIFESKTDMELYHDLVFKLQMHKFGIKGDLTPLKIESEYIPFDLLELEVYRTLKNHSEKTGEYHSFVENFQKRGKPPPNNLENYGLEDA